MKVAYELSRLAQQDLEEIWIFTAENWSIDQANKYYELIVNELELICDSPHRGVKLLKTKGTHRIRKVKSHLIVYKVEQNVIWVDRILHRRMDIEARLSDF